MLRILTTACGLALLASPVLADGPVPLTESASRMTIPEGFRVSLFAGEPEVRQPIAMTVDARGRLWVAENFSYPNWQTKPEGKDRIVIFEDTDGDGKFDKRKIFWEQGANLTGLTLGFGGVWACETPNLVFIPDLNGDDVPDGEPIVELDGWDVNARHNLFNSLNWGPDGWLYGCNGILSNSKVGRPGTSDADRVPINCGVWRYHPTRKIFEAVAHGTTNPWGLDFDDHGQAFITNCVIPHLYRVIPGARFQRMFGADFNKYAYDLMNTSADHIHWAGGHWTDSRGGLGQHGEAGGGHAHVGAMIYLGDNWPTRYRDTVFTCNVHGYRVNNDRLRREGASYIASHNPDFLKANDTWFRGIDLEAGPDGGAYLADWTDTGECHENDDDGPHRENGRIYKITYGTPKSISVDLSKLASIELARLQAHPNEWHVRQSRLILQERAAKGDAMADVHSTLRSILSDDPVVTRKLRAIWTLFVTGGLEQASLLKLTEHSEEWIRAWAIRLLIDQSQPSEPLQDKLATLAKSDPSPLVRLEIASALGKLPVRDRLAIAEGLLSHSEDATDASIPLMAWYAVEPIAGIDREKAVDLAGHCQIPLIRRYFARRIVAEDDQVGDDRGVSAVVGWLADPENEPAALDLMDGLVEAYRGRKSVSQPKGWSGAYDKLILSPNPQIRDRTIALALQFDDERAVASLKKLLSEETATLERRGRALQLLVERRIPGIVPQLIPLLDQPPLRGPALRALGSYDDPGIPQAILSRYPRFSEVDRLDAISTLSSRTKFALAMLEAVASDVIPRRDLSATTARQLLALGDPNVVDKLGRSWGTIRSSNPEKESEKARYRAMLAPDRIKSADPTNGRAIFGRSCLSCHKLYGEGGIVGPELTGSDRANLEYVLENVLDPSALVPREYRMATVATADGRVLSGIIQERTDRTLTLQTSNEKVVLPAEDVEEVKETTQSMMPEGLFEKLTEKEVRDLVAYLATKTPPAK
ncbi:PVC-type heme-binding CxxCH protein [Tundrisphaera lichenicola]|uniref:PVC-type heme-binding CxxCH protein n=1 Tax=Tundrisphaera lichenicola TaxID=2029860 RepID=UPI003EC149AB